MNDQTNSKNSAFIGWHQGSGLHDLRKLIWKLADPNSIEEKWMDEQFARMNIGLERAPYEELQELKPPPIVDNGEVGLERQLRNAVNRGMSYLEAPSLASEPEYPHILARQRLGFTHPIEDDTPEQLETFYREELRIVHETLLGEAVYNLGEATDAQHLAYLQKQVDRRQDFLDRLDRGEIKSGIQENLAKLPTHEV